MSHPLRLLIGLTLFGGSLAWGGTPSEVTMAVSPFDDSSEGAALAPLSQGLAQMLITDLSVSDELALVERARLQDVFEELALQQSAWADPESAVALGRGLGADFLLTGNTHLEGDTVRIDARVIDVASASVALSVSVTGGRSDVLSLEQDLAVKLLAGLGDELTLIERRRIGKGSTTDLDAFTHYSAGLDRLDAGDRSGAAERFGAAVREDPGFVLAEEARRRIEAQLAEVAAVLDDARISRLARYEAGARCACSYSDAGDPASPDPLSQPLGAQLGRRFMGAGNGTIAGLISEVQGAVLLSVAVDYVHLGLADEANALLSALNSDAYAQTRPVSWSAPDEHLAKLGIEQKWSKLVWTDAHLQQSGRGQQRMTRLHRCYTDQVASWAAYFAGDVERAAELQARAAERGTAAGVGDSEREQHGYCMNGNGLRFHDTDLEGASLSARLASVMSDAVELNAVRDRWKARRQVSSTARDRIDAAVAELTCAELCPWP